MKHFSDTTWIESQKSKGMSEESIENLIKSESIFAPIFVDQLLLPNMNFNGHYLIKNNISIPKKAIKLYISYTLCIQLKNLNTDFTLGNWVISLFGSIRPTRMLIQANTSILVTAKDLVLVQSFYLQLESMKKSHYSWYWYELICAY